MDHIFLFEEFRYNDVKIKSSKHLFDSGYQIDYKFWLDDDYVGKCEIETKFMKEDFDDRKDFFFQNTRFDWENPVKPEYYKKFPYIIELHGVEIEPEWQSKGIGTICLKKVLRYLITQFPKSNGIYLNVYEDNINAIKIYKKLGFKILTKEKSVSGNKNILSMVKKHLT